MSVVAPFQLWMDGAPVTSGIRSGSTVTITTSSQHNLVTGSFVQIQGFTGDVGSTFNGVYTATSTSGTTFTFSAAGSAGTAVTTSTRTAEAYSLDLMSPLGNYAAAARPNALYISLESLNLSASGDGDPSAIKFTVYQDVTPSAGPWFLQVPDQTRIRLVNGNTGDAPVSGKTFFRGFVQELSARINESGQGTITDVSGLDVNALLDRVVIYGDVR